MVDTIRTTATLAVPGAMLYYEVRGTGPLLLIAQSGDGDAGRSAQLTDQLVCDFTVASYDRRGLSHSRLDDPDQVVTPEIHADDLHRLLGALTDRPAFVLGCSLGALYGLHLAADHPEQVATLIAHDPATPGLLPRPDADRIRRTLDDIGATYQRDGWQAAMTMVGAATGLDPATMETEPGYAPPPANEYRLANLDFFLSNDIPQLAFSALGADDVARAAATRIVPAAGRTSHRAWNHQCAQELASALGTEVAEFPGGHNGNTTHPRAYAARLRDLLA